jgi:phage-related tail fiber protein
MGVEQNANYKVFNGTDLDTIHFTTKAELVAIKDTNDKFVATDTEGALLELKNAHDSHLAEDATTTKKGHVQLSTSTSSTSTVLAATPSAVKAAYDKANAALPKAGGTMTGILTAQSNTSYTVRQVRNMILSTADADVNAMQNGDVWIKYK